MLMYYVIDEGEWDAMPMTEQDAELMRDVGYILIQL